MVKYWVDDISGNIETWHHKCASQKKQNDTFNGVAIATLLAPVSFCLKHKYPHLQPLKWHGTINTIAMATVFFLNQEPSTPHNLLMGVKTIWVLCLFQVAPFVPFQRLQMGIFNNPLLPVFLRRQIQPSMVLLYIAPAKSF